MGKLHVVMLSDVRSWPRGITPARTDIKSDMPEIGTDNRSIVSAALDMRGLVICWKFPKSGPMITDPVMCT